jgi:hypothetical protein
MRALLVALRLTPDPQALDIGLMLCAVLLVLVLAVVLVALQRPDDDAPPPPPRARTLVPPSDARRLETELREDIARTRAHFLDRRPSPEAARDH